jgi:hypothetical protein
VSGFVRQSGGVRRTAAHGNKPDNDATNKLCADRPPRGSITIDAAGVHLLSNHLAVILGFVELLLADAPANDPRRADLLEVRAATIAAANLIGKQTKSESGDDSTHVPRS